LKLSVAVACANRQQKHVPFECFSSALPQQCPFQLWHRLLCATFIGCDYYGWEVCMQVCVALTKRHRFKKNHSPFSMDLSRNILGFESSNVYSISMITCAAPPSADGADGRQFRQPITCRRGWRHHVQKGPRWQVLWTKMSFNRLYYCAVVERVMLPRQRVLPCTC